MRIISRKAKKCAFFMKKRLRIRNSVPKSGCGSKERLPGLECDANQKIDKNG